MPAYPWVNHIIQWFPTLPLSLCDKCAPLIKAGWRIYQSMIYVNIAKDNDLAHGRRQPNADSLSIGNMRTNFTQISLKIHLFSRKKKHLKKCRLLNIAHFVWETVSKVTLPNRIHTSYHNLNWGHGHATHTPITNHKRIRKSSLPTCGRQVQRYTSRFMIIATTVKPRV